MGKPLNTLSFKLQELVSGGNTVLFATVKVSSKFVTCVFMANCTPKPVVAFKNTAAPGVDELNDHEKEFPVVTFAVAVYTPCCKTESIVPK